MSGANPQALGLLGKLVIAIAILLVAAGALWHGVTLRSSHRIWSNLVERPSEPMSLRFVLQPLMAVIAAIGDGLEDARSGRSPYFWTMMHDPQERIGRLNEGLNATARIILLGVAMDVIYQAMVLRTFYPVEALIIALLLAFVPYLIVRGLVVRLGQSRFGGPLKMEGDMSRQEGHLL
jgi:hypothetical protein